MSEVGFMRWLTSQGLFECSSPYRHTFDPIRGFWSIEDSCDNRAIVFYDTSFNEVYKVFVDRHFGDRVEGYQKEISKIFEL